MAPKVEQKFLFLALTGMVAGSTVRASMFPLPRTFGDATGRFGAIIVWTIVAGGTYMLAHVFLALAERKPDLDARVLASSCPRNPATGGSAGVR